MATLLIQIVALLSGPAAVLIGLRGRQRSETALASFGPCTGLWLVSLSYLLHRLELMTGDVAYFLSAVLIHALGSLGYVLFSPPLYHTFLEVKMRRPWRWSYALLNGTVLFLALGLGWERYRGLAVTLLHAVLYLSILYGIILGTIYHRRLGDAVRRKGFLLFSFLALLLLSPIYLVGDPRLLAPFLYRGWYDPLAYPLFLLGLSLSFLLWCHSDCANRGFRHRKP